MADIREGLLSELEATTSGLQRRLADLQQNVAKLQQMLRGSTEDWNQYQYTVWTQGEAARCVAEITSLLSRQQTLQKILSQLSLPDEIDRDGKE